VIGVVEHTTPYPWPYDAALSSSRTALVVVGWSSTWWQRCHQPELVVDPISRLADVVDHVVVVDHSPPQFGVPRPSTASWSSDQRVLPSVPGADSVTAAGIDGFFGGPLDAVLRAAHCDLILLAGLGLEAAVHSTMRSANDRGYECLLVVDACAPLDPDLVVPAISMVEMSGGIFGAIGMTDPVLAAFGRASCSKGTP
jgi:nicotinamidase-related amidase